MIMSCDSHAAVSDCTGSFVTVVIVLEIFVRLQSARDGPSAEPDYHSNVHNATVTEKPDGCQQQQR
jgi:hypothetical protein